MSEGRSTYNNQGNVLLELKRPQQALASYDKALQLRPDQTMSTPGITLASH